MLFSRNIFVVAIGLLAFGLLRQFPEHSLQQELQSAGLLEQALATSQKEQIGQTAAAVALGGLRTVVATFLNLRAYASFDRRDWSKLEAQFETLVLLQPRSRYYWDVGAWHLAYNAASDYQEREDLPAPRRLALHRAYVFKGRAFLERGVQQNPQDWQLLSSLGRFYSVVSKYPDFQKAADCYRRAWETGRARRFEARAWLYCLARVEGQQSQALELARRLMRQDEKMADTQRCLTFVLEMSQPHHADVDTLVRQCFGHPQQAKRMLQIYRDRNAEQLPITGVDAALERLNHVD